MLLPLTLPSKFVLQKFLIKIFIHFRDGDQRLVRAVKFYGDSDKGENL